MIQANDTGQRFQLAIRADARQVWLTGKRGACAIISALRIVLGLLGLAFVFIGLQFLTDPVVMGSDFGLRATGNGGLSTIRADMTALFWVAGGALLLGAWTGRAEYFLVPAALMGIVFAARCVSLALDGTYTGWQMPMIIEAVTVIGCALAIYRMRKTAS